jgi:hypothetical protein
MKPILVLVMITLFVGFSNADQAAMNIMSKINPTSQVQEKEYGGFTYEQGGTTYYTKPTTDNIENTWDPKNHGVSPDTPGASQYTLDPNQIVSGWYHTHPFVPNPVNGQNLYDSEHFSGWLIDNTSPNPQTGFYGDMHLSDITGIPAYVITPTDRMWRYDPPAILASYPYIDPTPLILGTIVELQGPGIPRNLGCNNR